MITAWNVTNPKTQAEIVCNLIHEKQPIAFTLECNYCVMPNGQRILFCDHAVSPPRVISRTRTKHGRAKNMVVRYADNSRIRFTYSPGSGNVHLTPESTR